MSSNHTTHGQATGSVIGDNILFLLENMMIEDTNMPETRTSTVTHEEMSESDVVDTLLRIHAALLLNTGEDLPIDSLGAFTISRTQSFHRNWSETTISICSPAPDGGSYKESGTVPDKMLVIAEECWRIMGT